MVASTEESRYITSLSEGLSKSAPANITPLSPERYIGIPKIEYSVEDLLEKAEAELEELGITEDEILDTIEANKGFIVRNEKKLVETEEVMTWATNYWNALNQSFENRYAKSSDKAKLMYTDVRMRAVGITKFLDLISDYTDSDTYGEVRDILTTACDIYILAEDASQNLKLRTSEQSRAIGRAVGLGFTHPKSLDSAMSLVTSSHLEKVGLYDSAEQYMDGIKAEFMAAKMLASFEYADVGYDISFSKPEAYRDASEAIDFVLKIADGKNEKELAVFDVKKAAYVSREGCCRLVPDKGRLRVFEGDMETPAKSDMYVIPEGFERTVLKNNEAGIVIRLPKKLVETSSVLEIDEMDNAQNSDYNYAKSLLFREITCVLERIGN